jgi:hypothetical protein
MGSHNVLRVVDEDGGDAATSAGVGAEDVTMVVPDIVAARSGVPVAWSQGDGPHPVSWEDDSDRMPWGWLLPRVAVFLVSAGTIAGGVAMVGGLMMRPPAAAAVQAPAVVAVPVAEPAPPMDTPTRLVMPPDAAHLPTGGALFNALIRRAGIAADNPGDTALADRAGREICFALGEGFTPAQEAAQMVSSSRFSDGQAPTLAQAEVMVSAARQVYCPQS